MVTSSMKVQRTTDDGPDYGVEVQADELLADLVEMAQDAAERRDEYREWVRDEMEYGYSVDPQFQYLVTEQTGLLTALGQAIACLQPENHGVLVRCFREDDGTVDVRGFMQWLSKEADAAHEVVNERRNAPLSSKMETGYCRVMALLRDDYGVGWPRLDDLGGNPLPEDLP